MLRQTGFWKNKHRQLEELVCYCHMLSCYTELWSVSKPMTEAVLIWKSKMGCTTAPWGRRQQAHDQMTHSHKSAGWITRLQSLAPQQSRLQHSFNRTKRYLFENKDNTFMEPQNYSFIQIDREGYSDNAIIVQSFMILYVFEVKAEMLTEHLNWKPFATLQQDEKLCFLQMNNFKPYQFGSLLIFYYCLCKQQDNNPYSEEWE